MAEFEVNPYEVQGKVDYRELAKRFGIRELDGGLRERIFKAAGDSHFLIRRGVYFAHRELDWLLDKYENGEKFYVYTGIAPSGSMTVAHLLPFTLAKWLQDRFDADVYIQIPDEEKFLVKKNKTLEEIHDLAIDDARNIAALGFNPRKTRFFFDIGNADFMYKQAVRVAKHITFSTIKDAFGFSSETNIGAIFYTSMQAVGTFIKSVEEGKNIPCLIPMGVDQDVHFRIARDVVDKLGYYKPATIESVFMPGLKGQQKMSASDPDNTIYLNDDEETVVRKANRAITGQQATAELQRKHGGDPDRCAICQYYRFFFEPDDRKLENIFEAERRGTVLAGEHKKHFADTVNRFLKGHRKKKDAITDIERFFLET
ncbi:MAG: tryptophan--tRNA ligase [Candidatus Marsarchaeota archaeon]|nr:tryptophan--tRNA ligase [Candidatus Marsarchaeota archaeon]